MAAARAAYSQLLQTWPLSAKFVTSLVLAAVSNIVAQLPSGRINPRSALKYGLLDAPPHSHFWYMLLEAFVPSPLVRTIIDTLIYGPLTSVYFYIGSTLLIDGGTWADAKAKMAGGRFLRTVVAGWKFWPLVQYGNQRWVPFHYRTLTMDIAGFVWNVYMSIATQVSRISSDEEPVVRVGAEGGADTSSMVSYYRIGERPTEPSLAGQYRKQSDCDADESSMVSYYRSGEGSTEPSLAGQYRK
jgi:hypothetical protein